MKTILIWVVAHVVIASLVTEELLRQGRTEEEAKVVGHVAGTAAGYVLSSRL